MSIDFNIPITPENKGDFEEIERAIAGFVDGIGQDFLMCHLINYLRRRHHLNQELIEKYRFELFNKTVFLIYPPHHAD